MVDILRECNQNLTQNLYSFIRTPTQTLTMDIGLLVDISFRSQTKGY